MSAFMAYNYPDGDEILVPESKLRFSFSFEGSGASETCLPLLSMT